VFPFPPLGERIGFARCKSPYVHAWGRLITQYVGEYPLDFKLSAPGFDVFEGLTYAPAQVESFVLTK